MRHEQHGSPAGGPFVEQFTLEQLPGHGIQCAERLIHQQQSRLAEEGPRHGDALLHARGKLMGIGSLAAGQSKTMEHGLGRLFARSS